MAENLILAEQRFTTVLIPNLGCYGMDVPATIEVVLGETYKIRFDNEDYVCSPIDVSAMLPGALALGNGAGFGLPGNGEPFIVAVYSDSEEISVFSLLDTEPTEHTISIYHVVEEDKDYLIKGSTLKAIGNAIREKTGKTDAISPNDMPGEIRGITGGGSGGSSDDVRYVTFMSYDGTVEYGKKAVAVGDDCADPIARGLFGTPTRESTAYYVYTFAGWSTTANGGLDNNALKSVTADRAVYANFISTTRLYTVRLMDGNDVLYSTSVAYGQSVSYVPNKDGHMFLGWNPEPTNVTSDMDCYAQWQEKLNFATASWERIANISKSGEAANYFNVGDSKQFTLTYNDNTTEVITVAIAGFGLDPLSSGGFAGLSLVMTHAMKKGHIFDSNDVELNLTSAYENWDSCEIRAWLNGDILFAMPPDLQSVIMTVNKQSLSDTRATSDLYQGTTEDKVWLLGLNEIGCVHVKGEIAQSFSYPIFTDDASRVRIKTGETAGSIWWLRDKQSTSHYHSFGYVYENGALAIGGMGCTSNLSVCFGFCV